MFDNKLLKGVIKVLILGVLVYAIILMIDESGQLRLKPAPNQEYVTAHIDSTIAVHRLNPKSPNEVVDSVHIPDFTPLKTKADSDSLVRYDLYRQEQAVVTIDLEEHNEAVFFTWDDIKTYFQGVIEFIEKLKNK